MKPFLRLLFGYTPKNIPEISIENVEKYSDPFIVKMFGTATTNSIDAPISTITSTGNNHYIAEPFIVKLFGASTTNSVDEPISTITAGGGNHYICSFLVEYYGNARPQSIHSPLPTLTTKDRFALIILNGTPCKLEIRYRLLSPEEMAKAMSFPEDYVFSGNRGEVVKQIGNAVPVKASTAHLKELIK